MDSIVKPGGKPSTSFDRYLYECLAERIMGHPRTQSVTMWMSRGTALEERARKFYEFTRDATVQEVGFITNDEKTIGASPDGLVGEDGCLEIKCPSDHIHVGYLLSQGGKSVDKAYRVQTQAQLWITERQFVDIISFHPEMPEALFRVERDETFINFLSERVMEFSKVLEHMSLQLIDSGLIQTKAPVEHLDARTFVTQADADAILKHHFPQMYDQATH